MGRSTTPTYVVRYVDQQGVHQVIWNTKQAGRPTKANLETWRKKMNESMKLGGCNEHISKALGFMPHVCHAVIINQKLGDRKSVVSVIAPLFEVI